MNCAETREPTLPLMLISFLSRHESIPGHYALHLPCLVQAVAARRHGTTKKQARQHWHAVGPWPVFLSDAPSRLLRQRLG